MKRPQKKATQKKARLSEAGFAVRTRTVVPHEFVLDALAPADPHTRPLFSCVGVYVRDSIVLALRGREDRTRDNGVWLATTAEHHASLKREFPSMRSIEMLGKEVTGWQVLPVDAPDFEEAALHACELILARDPRIGKVPTPRGRRSRPRVARARRT